MKIKKRLLGILYNLAMVLGVMLGMSLTVHATPSDSLYVGGVKVTEENKSDVLSDGKVRYDSNTKTLTLQDATINAQGRDAESYGIVYRGSGNLNIVLSGNSRISAVNISGDGSLTAISSSGRGIYTPGTIKIDGGIVNAKGSSNGIQGDNGVTIKKGKVTAEGESAGIIAKDLEIENGTVTATGTNEFSSQGIYATGGGLGIKDGTVSALGKIGILAFGDVTISSGTVEAKGRDGNGIEAKDSGVNGGSVTINGGKVTAISRIAVDRGESVCSIRAAKNILISGGEVTAEADDVGIYADGKISISKGIITATGGSTGIESGGSVEIIGGTVTVTGNE